jgi:alpha-L-arabinofuranosidase
MAVSCHQNVRQNHNILTANKFFENVANFMYMGTIVTNQDYIREEIKSRSLVTILFRVYRFTVSSLKI